MSDLEISRSETLSRADAAALLRSLADALAADGSEVHLQLGDSKLELKVPDEVRAEVEVEVDGDEVELECELTWSTAGRRGRKSRAAAEPA
ncbi:hypothetical protein GCM10023215_35390 [Pseudonocardia yuanmonensis]|uniref:Amphi-Trp domain-containing protein n=1 Tax=Pseudonocardia yuanmonensis TaxID=1095914 RepID=A0ABP8WS91_9PSEU